MAEAKRPEDRFGPNGAVMDEMSDRMRTEYEEASQFDLDRTLPGLVTFGLLLIVTLIGVYAANRDALDLSWYVVPRWLPFAWFGSVLVQVPILAARAGARWLRGGRFFQTGQPDRLDAALRALPLGVGIAAVTEAAFQLAERADAGAMLP